MLTNQLAIRYARAIYEIAKETAALKEFGAQINLIKETIAGQEDLADFMYHPHIKPEAKKEVLEKIFKGQLADEVYKFLMLLVDKRREGLLKQIAAEYEVLANIEQNVLEAEVVVARPLSKEQEAKLIKKLSDTTKKTVVIQTKIDASILGGVIVKIGDKLIDGSVLRQMQVLKRNLLTNEAAKIGVTE